MALFTLCGLEMNTHRAVDPLSRDSQASALACAQQLGAPSAPPLAALLPSSEGASLTLRCAPSPNREHAQEVWLTWEAGTSLMIEAQRHQTAWWV